MNQSCRERSPGRATDPRPNNTKDGSGDRFLESPPPGAIFSVVVMHVN